MRYLQERMQQLQYLLHELEIEKTEMFFSFSEVNTKNNAHWSKLLTVQKEVKYLNCN